MGGITSFYQYRLKNKLCATCANKTAHSSRGVTAGKEKLLRAVIYPHIG